MFLSVFREMKVFRIILTLSVIVAFGGCGRYSSPVPPELVAPEAVSSLTIQAQQDGVDFTWRASDQDQRGKELKFIDGYRVARKEVKQRGDETDPAIPFDEVGFLPDTHVEIREKLRKDAREKGEIGRRLKPPEETLKFAYSDKGLESGKTYVYQIIPINQGGVKGEVKQLLKVYFTGENSDISIIDSATGVEKDTNKDDEDEDSGPRL